MTESNFDEGIVSHTPYRLTRMVQEGTGLNFGVREYCWRSDEHFVLPPPHLGCHQHAPRRRLLAAVGSLAFFASGEPSAPTGGTRRQFVSCARGPQ